MLRTTLAITFLVVIQTAAAQENAGMDSLLKDTPLKNKEVVAFFGDSITQSGANPGGYCRLIGDAIDSQLSELGVTIVYAGISGHKVPNLQERLQRDILSKNPSVVFIYIGINDVWHSQNGRGTSKDKFESGLRDLIARITKSNATIVLCTPSTIGEKTDGSNKLDPMLEDYAAISRRVANETNITLCDLRKQFLDHLKSNNPDNKERGVLTTDGVHLNAAGNQFVADRASEAIATALRQRNESVSSRNSTKSLFNGKDLTGWHDDIPKKPESSGPTFVVRDGNLVSLGNPRGHLITDESFRNYRLHVEYRFPGKPGNCGVLVHSSTPRALYKMFPQ